MDIRRNSMINWVRNRQYKGQKHSHVAEVATLGFFLCVAIGIQSAPQWNQHVPTSYNQVLQEDARGDFVYQIHRLEETRLRLIEDLNEDAVADLTQITERLNELPHDLEWEPAMKKQLKDETKQWKDMDKLVDQNKNKKAKWSDRDEDIHKVLKAAITKLTAVLHSLCS